MSGQPTPNGATLVERLSEAISRLAAVAQEVAEAQSRLELALRSRQLGPIPACAHPDGHEIKLRPVEALAVETARECPCCGARLWISFPSVGMLLDAAALGDDADVPVRDVVLTRRERQVLKVLHSSRYPLTHGQLAALVWSDSDRTHDVRSVLYRLRLKLRNSGWAIPFPPNGQGIRLVPVDKQTGRTPPKPSGDELDIHEPSEAAAA